MQFSRRQWLNLAASLLSWFGGLRRLFSPPPEIVEVSKERFGAIFMNEYRRRLHTDEPLTELLRDTKGDMIRLMLDVKVGPRVVRYARPWEHMVSIVFPRDATEELLATDGPYHSTDTMERLRLLRGSNREGMTIKHAVEFIRAVTKDRTLS
jgi:hypothetical protein